MTERAHESHAEHFRRIFAEIERQDAEMSREEIEASIDESMREGRLWLAWDRAQRTRHHLGIHTPAQALFPRATTETS